MTMRYAHLALAHMLAAVEGLVTARQIVSEAQTVLSDLSATSRK
jgi:hypothetical protein